LELISDNRIGLSFVILLEVELALALVLVLVLVLGLVLVLVLGLVLVLVLDLAVEDGFDIVFVFVRDVRASAALLVEVDIVLTPRDPRLMELPH